MTNKEAIQHLVCGKINCLCNEYDDERLRAKCIEVLKKQELLEAMKGEEEVVEYLSTISKDTLIDLFLQMRFERDLYMEMYERREEE